jgi:hypothetical protein
LFLPFKQRAVTTRYYHSRLHNWLFLPFKQRAVTTGCL